VIFLEAAVKLLLLLSTTVSSLTRFPSIDYYCALIFTPLQFYPSICLSISTSISLTLSFT
jgi:hypothetical protein